MPSLAWGLKVSSSKGVAAGLAVPRTLPPPLPPFPHSPSHAAACGHPHIVHGGAISSLLDDSLGTLFIANGCTGFTANLNVNFRKPLPAGTTVYVEGAIARVETSKSGSKKVTLVGRVVDAASPAVVYTEATALFISKDIPASSKMVASLQETYGTAAAAAEAAAAEAAASRAASPSSSSAGSPAGGGGAGGSGDASPTAVEPPAAAPIAPATPAALA